MKYSHDFYWKCGVVMLGQLFEKIFKNSIKNYGPYQSHYLSAQALNWDAILKNKKNKLELIADPDICIYSLKRYKWNGKDIRWNFL